LNHSVNVLGKNVHAMSKVWFYGGVAMKKEQIDIPSYVICCLRRLKFDINREIRKIIVTQMDQICLFCHFVYIMTTIESQYWMFS